MADWESQIAGERMAVDGEFNERVAASDLSSQQWNLVMTAVDFEIVNPTTPEDAELVADTSKLGSILPELERVEESPRMPSGDDDSSDSDGLLDGVLSSLGLSGGGGGGDEFESEATQLADDYADRLQSKLKERGRWTSICEQAAST